MNVKAVIFIPDVLFSKTLLSQNNASPVDFHHVALKRACRHPLSTINDRFHFWKPVADPKLTSTKLSTLHKHIHNSNIPNSSDFEPVSFADAD